jgi:hypothetical protein
MRRPLALFAVLATAFVAAAAPAADHVAQWPTTPLVVSPGAPAYTVRLTGDATGTVWSGHESVRFANTAGAPLDEVYLRLWDNAHGTCAAPPITVTALTGGTADAPSVDCTALRVTLPVPVPPGQRATVGFDLKIDVPSGADRFGHDGAYSFLGNALPVLALKDAAGWHLDPYTNNGEAFYTTTADYTVTLDHPADLQVPATGTAVDLPAANGRVTTLLHAAQVRDFAWAAGPFRRTEARSRLGVRITTYATDSVSPADAQQMLDLATTAIDSHADRFGPYPYGGLAIVLDNHFWFSGMEYPAFVLDRVKPSAVVHELAHQWWYGIVGDDESRAPWLDESFADYATDLAMGKQGESCWNAVTWESPDERLTSPMSYWDAHPKRYDPVVYEAGKCALHDLRRLLGTTTMAALLRRYAQTHWYGISTTADFKAAAQSVTATHLSDFWHRHRIDG